MSLLYKDNISKYEELIKSFKSNIDVLNKFLVAKMYPNKKDIFKKDIKMDTEILNKLNDTLNHSKAFKDSVHEFVVCIVDIETQKVIYDYKNEWIIDEENYSSYKDIDQDLTKIEFKNCMRIDDDYYFIEKMK